MSELPIDGLDEDLLSLERGIDLLEADPVSLYRAGPQWQATFIENLVHRIYAHPANKTGKTTILVVVALALLQGRKKLAGIDLPRLPSPCIGALFSLDYKQQRLAVQETLKRWLGRWPAKIEWDGQTMISLAVKPGYGDGYWAASPPGDEPREWSRLGLYSQKNLQSGTGFRLHFAGFDEPPIMSVYREVLKAGFPGWPFPTFIGATSIKRSQWYPLRDYFPLESEGKVVNGVIRISGSVYDPGTCLSAADIADLERRYAPDPDRRARLYGDEINSEGASPFRGQLEELRRWMDRASNGQMREWKIAREVTTSEGKQLVTEVVEVEVWDDPKSGHRYRLVADPSLGIDDGLHDPGEVVVWDMTDRVDVARFNGYIGEYGLGVLAGGLGRKYDCVVDPETGGGYGSGFLSGLRASGWTRVVNSRGRNQSLDRTHIGFSMSADLRMQFAAVLNELLLASSQGHPWLTIRSAGILSDLLDLVVDENGKPITAPGTHDEGFITSGRIATLLAPDRRVAAVLPRRAKRELSIRERGMKAYYEKLGIEPPRQKVAPRRPKPRFGMGR